MLRPARCGRELPFVSKVVPDDSVCHWARPLSAEGSHSHVHMIVHVSCLSVSTHGVARVSTVETFNLVMVAEISGNSCCLQLSACPPREEVEDAICRAARAVELTLPDLIHDITRLLAPESRMQEKARTTLLRVAKVATAFLHFSLVEQDDVEPCSAADDTQHGRGWPQLVSRLVMYVVVTVLRPFVDALTACRSVDCSRTDFAEARHTSCARARIRAAVSRNTLQSRQYYSSISSTITSLQGRRDNGV